MRLLKNFSAPWFLNDCAWLQVRLEATNALNRVNFNGLNMQGDLAKPALFDKCTGVWTPRFFQVALHSTY